MIDCTTAILNPDLSLALTVVPGYKSEHSFILMRSFEYVIVSVETYKELYGGHSTWI